MRRWDCSFGQHKRPGHQNKPVVKVRVGNTIIPTTVDTSCTWSMIWADPIPSHLGSPESPGSVVCIHGASHTYKHQQIWLTVLGHMEELQWD